MQGKTLSRKNLWTPWGKAQQVLDMGDGVIFTSTAGHGGFRVNRKLYLQACREKNVPVYPKIDNQVGNFVWFEEDCDWCFVTLAFPQKFNENYLKVADDTLKTWYPDQWEAVHGRKLEEGESRARDKQLFKERHADDFQAVWCERVGMSPLLIVGACKGGRTDSGKYASPVNTYLVSEERYDPGRFGYLISEGDIRVSEKEIHELKEMVASAWESDSRDWLVRSVTPTENGSIQLTCAPPKNRAVSRTVLVPAEEWENRGDIRQMYIVNEQGAIEVFRMPESEEEVLDFGVSP